MHKQGKKDKMDESLGMRRGKESSKKIYRYSVLNVIQKKQKLIMK